MSRSEVADRFSGFLAAFPPEQGMQWRIDADSLVVAASEQFGVHVPEAVIQFWRVVAAGYFGGRRLFFFGDTSTPRDLLTTWNARGFWRDIFPEPGAGGPFFFAETCFGDQIGFRWEAGRCKMILFVIDTYESFVLAEDDWVFFERVLRDSDALVDPGRLSAVRNHLGELPPGMHYAPIVSPMVGGSSDAENFNLETPLAHFVTAVATYKATAGRSSS